MTSIPDWQQAQESEFFNWRCIICHDLAKSPLHLEDQFLVEHGIYLDITMMNGLNAANALTHIMYIVSKVNLPKIVLIFAHLWHAKISRSKSKCTLVSVLNDCRSNIFVLVFICFSLFMFSMGWKGKHPKKHIPSFMGRQCQSHQGEKLNQWSELDMEAAILEYHR